MNRREFMQGVFGVAVSAVVPLPVQKPIQWLHISEQATWDGKEFRCNPAQTRIPIPGRSLGHFDNYPWRVRNCYSIRDSWYPATLDESFQRKP